ncbi:MAG: sulfatase [Flavobacteriaceae bacterium]|nr:sulfatase [Flavobacteriaceae bacterium]
MKYLLSFLLFASLIFGCESLKKSTSQSPNIILFFVDDMGWQDTSVPFWSQPTKFNKIYKTPNMERLAKKGIKFTNAYATPVCSPTRVSLMTGMNAARHRVTNWTLRPDQKQPMELNHPSLIFPDWNFNGLGLNPSTPNTVYAKPLPQLLSEKGYYTIHAGKAHFGAIGYPSSNPLNLGFDVNIAGHAAGAPGSYLGLENFGNGDPDREVWAVPGLEKYHGQDIFLTEALTQEVFSALDQPVQKNKPFFLYFSLYGIHTPLMANERYVEPYRKMGLEEPEARYASMIESMDKALGNLMEYLEENQLEKNTVILFMSDNGGLSAVARGGEKHTHNIPLKSGKGSIYEGGIRVPMLAYWPNITQAETINSTPLIIEDFFPSILEMAQIDTNDFPQTIDGQSFVPLLQNNTESQTNRPLFWHYPNEWGPEGPGIGSYSAVRQGDWKLIYFHTNKTFELYNLKDDIRENQNLLSSDYEKAKQLSIKLTQYLKKVNAQMPLDKLTKEIIPYPSNLAYFKE